LGEILDGVDDLLGVRHRDEINRRRIAEVGERVADRRLAVNHDIVAEVAEQVGAQIEAGIF
jgi:hypothetical protein